VSPQDRFANAQHAKAFRGLDQAVALERNGFVSEADNAYADVIRKNPQYFDAFHLYGLFKFKNGQLSDAAGLIEKAHKLNPHSLNALNSLAVVYAHLKNFDQALQTFSKIIERDQNNVQALSNMAQCLNELGRFQETVDICDKILSLDRLKSDAYLARGAALLELNDYEQALLNYQAVVVFDQRNAMGWCGIGNALYRLKRPGEGLSAYDKALSIKSNLENAWLGRGNVLFDLQCQDEALAAYNGALSIKPDLENAWHGCGNVFFGLRRYGEALAAYDKALSISPDLAASVYTGRGNVYAELQQYDKAFAAYDQALSLDADLKYAESRRLHAKMQLCNWTNIETEIRQLLTNLRNDKPALPFASISIPSSPREQLQCAKSFVAEQGSFPALWRGEIYPHDRIRVAYLSSEFREHAVSYLAVGLFERHDKSRFEVTAISFEKGRDSEFCRRIKAAFEHFIDVSQQSDQEIANLIRQLEVDIAVDLNGFTREGRLGVLARRPAPIQVNYLGYAGTMGADYYDYIIADPTVVPREHFEFYSEKVAWLPHSFLVNDAARPIASGTPARSELGLPDKAFVFCCFNQPFKINPEIYDVWMRLLRDVDGSVLWLKDYGSVATDNLRREAERRGVEPERLIFAPAVPGQAEHLARHRQADLFLDTLYYNAHTTASDALWAGLPVLTCIGPTFAGRVGASLLNSIGLPELITRSRDEYETLARELALNREKLSNIRKKLDKNRMTMPLFDTALFARNMETAYEAMYKRQHAGFPLDHIEIRPIGTSG
jgi:protein O-GlcNAc transferase